MKIERPPRRAVTRFVVGVGVFLLLFACGWLAWQRFYDGPSRAAELVTAARRLQTAGNHREAERTAVAALKANPASADAALLAAQAAVAQRDYQTAVDYLRRIKNGDRRVELPAALLAAQLNREHLDRLGDAEDAYRRALHHAPNHIEANSGLATLLALCGRWREAVPHALRVVRQGQPTDLLVLLSRENGVVNEPGKLESAREAAPHDPSPLVGLAWHAASDERHEEAIKLLRKAVRLQPDFPAAHVALGTQLLAARKFDELIGWAQRLPAKADDFAETWIVRAQLAEESGDELAAIRCYLESLRRAPESRAANFQVARLLAESGNNEDSARFTSYLNRLHELEAVRDRVLLSNDLESVAPLLELAVSFESVGRLWEAFGWSRMAVHLDPYHREAFEQLERLRQEVSGLSLQQTASASNVASMLDVSRYPLPRLKSPSDTSQPSQMIASIVSFRDDAVTSGLHFQYFNGSDAPARRMFEFTGGGIGVLDFDVDGFPDIYFTQGRDWDAPTTDAYHDSLFRNIGGENFREVAKEAGISEDGFGQGISVGDFDSDGFPDFYVANIGGNQLWRNNGDGTFTDTTESAGVAGDDWTTSCVVADLNGDSLSDIYAVNYVMGEDVFERICRGANGTARLCMPYDFEGQPDRLWLNNGDGTFAEATSEFLSVAPRGKGLGISVWDAHGDGRLSVFVANDTTPNFFFESESSNGAHSRLTERGLAAGLGLNGAGKATGCMGVALGDVNEDGELDVFVTNFLAEANTLYVNSSPGFYRDETRERGLYEPSLETLGFGTQFLDADLDGCLELFVANGHVDDLRDEGKPYEMSAQLFRSDKHAFHQVPADTIGSYFSEKHLGRAAARIDWNLDGREDLIVGHLWSPSVILTNTTPKTGNPVSLRLVGIESNRDAIGTIVTAHVGDQKFIRQVTAGDGYQASNDRRLTIGTGEAQKIDRLIIRWPSGLMQEFHDVTSPSALSLTEGTRLLPYP